MLKVIKCFRSNVVLTNNSLAVFNSLETSKCFFKYFVSNVNNKILSNINRSNELKYGPASLGITGSKEMPRRKKACKTRKSPLKRKRVGKKCKAIVGVDSEESELEFIEAPKRKLLEIDSSFKKEIKDVSSASSDELEIVFDLQEDKKNRVYEVITVTSDDESVIDCKKKENKTDNNICKKESDVEDEIVCLGVYNNEYNISCNKQYDPMGSDSSCSFPLDLTNYGFSHPGLDTLHDVGLLKKKDDFTNKINSNIREGIEEIMLSSGPSSSSSWGSSNVNNADFNSTSAHSFHDLQNESNPGQSTSCLKLKVRKSSDMNYCIVNTLNKNFPTVSNLSSKSSSNTQSDRSSSRSSSSLTVTNDSDSRPDESSNNSCDRLSSVVSLWKEADDYKNKTHLRYEEFTDLGKKYRSGEGKAEGHNMIINLMSYNVLSQYLLDNHRYLYKRNSDATLGWELRWQLIYDEIENLRPDILCMQEVEESYLNDYYSQLLGLGYDYIYKKRTRSQVDGCAIYFNESKFDLERYTPLEFFNQGTFSLNRDNIALVARFRPKDSREDAIVVATTHLLYNPRRYDVRLAQMELLLAEIDKLAYSKKTKSYYPIILTGDFNEKPQGSVYQLVTKGEFRFEGLSYKSLKATWDHTRMYSSLIPQWKGITDHCQYVNVMKERKSNNHKEDGSPNLGNQLSEDDINKCFATGRLSHDLKLNSVYKTNKENGSFEASTLHDSWITVDYIFYSLVENRQTKQLEEGNLKLLSRLRLPTAEECRTKIKCLPNFAHGSDHLSLAAKFLLQLKVPSED